jgi:hypothetical protein
MRRLEELGGRDGFAEFSRIETAGSAQPHYTAEKTSS